MTQTRTEPFLEMGFAVMTEEETQRFHEELGRRIAKRRKELGLTQIELAERIEATQKIVTSYERATRQMPAWRLPEPLRLSSTAHGGRQANRAFLFRCEAAMPRA